MWFDDFGEMCMNCDDDFAVIRVDGFVVIFA